MKDDSVKVNTEDLLAYGIGRKFFRASLKDYKEPQGTGASVKKKIKEYMLDMSNKIKTGKGLFLFGAGVSGKSMLANLLAISAVAQKFSVLVTNLDKMTGLRFDKLEIAGEKYEDVLSKDILVVDDIFPDVQGDYRINDGMKKTLYDVIKRRSKDARPVIVCSRIPLEGSESVESIFGESVSTMLRLDTATVNCVNVENLIDD